MKAFGSDLIIKVLESNNTRYIFGIPGGHLLKFYDCLHSSQKITPILTKHESGASFMAAGYSQVSGNTGVCTGTVGPGATNLTTGIASAYMDSIPVLVITAQVGASALGKGGLQEATGEGRTIDHVELFNGMTKYSTRVFSPAKLHQSLRNALRVSINGRPGPVHLDIMAQIFASDLEFDESAVKEKIIRYPLAGQLTDIEKAVDLLLSSNNAVILAGAGAMAAHQEVLELADKFKIPVATTVRAKGIISEDHDLCLGCLGIYGTNVANKYLRSGIDVTLAVGVSFSEFTSHAWDSKFQPDRGLIQIDVDSWEIGKNYPAGIGIMGDSQLVLKQLLNLLNARGNNKYFSDVQKLGEMKKQRNYFADPEMDNTAAPVKPQHFLKSIRGLLPENVIIFGDIGNTLPWIESFFPVYAPNSFFICSSLASMGYGVSASIGGQLAAPDRQVICFCGDGDFQMQGMEVSTAVNYNIPVKWFVLNNQKLAMVSDIQDIMFKGRHIASEFINPDFVKLAEAMGAVGLRISKPDEIRPVVQEALKNGRPTVVDVVIDPDEAPSFDARAEAMTRAWGTSAPLYQKLKMVPEFLRRM